jgi:protein gp37
VKILGENSNIAWTDNTFNLIWGCTKVSPACEHCYAETWAKRTGFNVWGKNAERRTFGDKHWNEPIKWNKKAAANGKRLKVFCSSMADVFEDHLTVAQERPKLWELIKQTPNLDWLLLTKRPENIFNMVPFSWTQFAPENVWYGTTAENQEWYDKRVLHLFEVPAKVRFLSCEPLLGSIEVKHPVDWLISGGESGGKFRAMELDHVRSLRDQCKIMNIPFFFKQHSGLTPDKLGCLLDGKEYKEFPNLQIKS